MALQFDEKYRVCGGITVGDEQVEGINFLLQHRGAILAFQTGLGKSLVTAIASKILLDSFDQARIICVVPVKALKSWKREFFQRLGFSYDDVGILSTGSVFYNTDKNKVLIFTDTNIEKYRSVVEELQKKDYKMVLIVDEAHKLQDTKTKFYKVMRQVRALCPITWLVTATPLLNGLSSLYHVVNFGVPGFFGTKTSFENKYVIWHLKDQWVAGGRKIKIKVVDGYKNLNILNEQLKQVMIVRQKEYNLKFAYIQKDMTEEEYSVYEKVSSGLLDGTDDERNFSRRMHDLQRFLDRAYEGDDSMRDIVKAYNASDFSTKESTLIDTLQKCLNHGYSTIIYCDYKETVARLHKVLKKRQELGIGSIYEITGSIDIKKRERIEDSIGQRDIILITSAGTESINLQRCNCVILYDISFSSKQIIQTVGRICRRDSQFPYQYVLSIVMSKTIDEYKFRLFQTHLDMIQKVVGAGTDIPLNEEYLLQDSKDLQKLKDELLWAYRSSSKRKRVSKVKKQIKEKINVSPLHKAHERIASHKFLVEPIAKLSANTDIVEVPVLYPDKSLYMKYVNKEIPLSVLRSSYVGFLRSDKGKLLIQQLRQGVMDGHDILLVGDTEIPNILKDEVLESLKD